MVVPTDGAPPLAVDEAVESVEAVVVEEEEMVAADVVEEDDRLFNVIIAMSIFSNQCINHNFSLFLVLCSVKPCCLASIVSPREAYYSSPSTPTLRVIQYPTPPTRWT